VQQFEAFAIVAEQDAATLGGDQQLLVVVCAFSAQLACAEHIMPLGA